MHIIELKLNGNGNGAKSTATPPTPVVNDSEVDQIMEGLSGDIRIGARYFIFTVTYAYIGTVTKVTNWGVHLDNVMGVSTAGPEDDAVTKIVNNNKKPESSEMFGKPVIVAKQAITALIPSDQ